MPSPVFIRIGRSRSAPSGLFARLLAALVTLALLLLLLMFSLVAAGVMLVGGALVWGYLWWKTRALRRAFREQASTMPRGPRMPGAYADGADSMIIEGEVIREIHVPEDSTRQQGSMDCHVNSPRGYPRSQT